MHTSMVLCWAGVSAAVISNPLSLFSNTSADNVNAASQVSDGKQHREKETFFGKDSSRNAPNYGNHQQPLCMMNIWVYLYTAIYV